MVTLELLKRIIANRATYPINKADFIYGVTQGWLVPNNIYKSGYHHGTDFRVKMFQTVHAPHDGEIYMSGKSPQLGCYAFTEHEIQGNKYYYLFPHLEVVPPKRSIMKGEVIGRIGNTGLSTGPHLHVTSFRVKPKSLQHYVSLVNSREKIIKNTKDVYKEMIYLVDKKII